MNEYFRLREVGHKEWEIIPHAQTQPSVKTILNDAYMMEIRPNHVVLLTPQIHKAHSQVFLNREAATNHLLKTCMRYDAR